MIARSLFLAAATVAGLTGAALAQDQTAPAAPDPEAAYEGGRNQLGVLNYCQEEGHIDGEAVEIQTRLLTMIPQGDEARGAEAEAKGREGRISAMGVETTLADAATQQNTTEVALCQQMDQVIQQLGAQIES